MAAPGTRQKCDNMRIGLDQKYVKIPDRAFIWRQALALCPELSGPKIAPETLETGQMALRQQKALQVSFKGRILTAYVTGQGTCVYQR